MENNIIKMREAAGLSQIDLAKSIGWEQSRFSNLELGKRRLTIDIAAKIAEKIGCSIDDLYTGIIDSKFAHLKQKTPIEADPAYNAILVRVLDAWNTKHYNIEAVDLINITKKIFLDHKNASDDELNIVIDAILKHNSKND